MNLQQFLDHWQIIENPFRGEEARQDPVFLRLEAKHHAGGGPELRTASGDPAQPGIGYTGPGLGAATAHSEFEKIAGDFERPSTAIVFGEKGSGKTAIRLQLADRVAAFNQTHPKAKCLWIAYDDLNPFLTRFIERVGIEKKQTLTDSLAKYRLVDHIDAVLTLAVPPIVDAILDNAGEVRGQAVTFAPGPEPRKAARKWDKRVRQDLLVLQSVYDRHATGDSAEHRTRRLRRALRLSAPIGHVVWTALAYLGWIPVAATAYYAFSTGQLTFEPAQLTRPDSLVWVIAGLLLVYLVILFKRSVYDRLRLVTLAHRVRRQVRVLSRSDLSMGRSIRQIDPDLVDPSVLPMSSSDETRYAMLERLLNVLRPFGYSSVMVVIDRVDEPTQIAGDPDRMRAVVWPMLTSKFLQLPDVAVKMLLPMELRHALFRESAAFFQEARLDKQNLIERLSWTGATLYDLCNARLQTCRPDGAGALGLLDLFAEDVTRQDLIDALDQMHQPRDAFKMLYQCMTEHCASVPSDQASWRIPRVILDIVRKQQVERVKQLHRGVRPA